MKPVTDPALLAQLEAQDKPVEDPAVLAELEGKPAESSLGSQFMRALGRTVRAGVQGVTALPGLVADIPRNVVGTVQQAKDFMNGAPASTFLEGRESVLPSSAEAVRSALTKAGLPEAQNSTERVAEDIAGGMAGAGGMAKLGTTMANAASPIVRKIGEVLGTNVGGQVISSGTGAAAQGVTREEGGGAGAQLLAGLAGTLAPSAAQVSLAEIVRRAARGGEAGRQRVADTIRTFEEAGAGTPTVGQATQGRGARAVESGLSKTPGAAGRVIAKAEAEAAGLGDKVDDMAGTLSTTSGAAPAGREIRAGLGRFADRFKAKASELYDELDTHLAKDTRVDVTRTQDALAALNADIPGAPNLSRFFQNAKIKGIEGAMKADTLGEANVVSRMSPIEKMLFGEIPGAARTAMIQEFEDGKLPYEAVKKLRTLVGKEMENTNLVSDVPRSKWKALYAALSEDLGVAAKGAGPEAEKAFARASKYYSAGVKRIDDVLDPILTKTDPEDIYKAAVSGTTEGATTLRGVMKSLPEESRKVVAATTLRRLGRAVASKQDELGEVFSPETFLTNWNKLHGDAKTALFSNLPDGMRSDLDKIARVASNLRDGSKVFANPSGTAQAAANQFTAGAAVISLITGNLGTAAAIGGAVAGSNVLARVMTSPITVKWLAKATSVPVEQLPAQLNNLSQQIFRMPKDERDDARELVKTMRAALTSQEAGQPQ